MSATKGFGPEFQSAGSRLYRTEYAAIAMTVFAYMAYRSLYLGGIDWLSTAFWVFFPDLVAFIPIGLSSERQKWPTWGAPLYNAFHTILTWALITAVIWLTLRTPYWPIFGWLGHISLDRTVGYGLRENPGKRIDSPM